MYELTAIHDSHKSFYGKAHVRAGSIPGSKDLISYPTRVAKITAEGELRVFGFYSATTLRHIKEFAAQNGFGHMSKDNLRKYLVTEGN